MEYVACIRLTFLLTYFFDRRTIIADIFSTNENPNLYFDSELHASHSKRGFGDNLDRLA